MLMSNKNKDFFTILLGRTLAMIFFPIIFSFFVSIAVWMFLQLIPTINYTFSFWNIYGILAITSLVISLICYTIGRAIKYNS